MYSRVYASHYEELKRKMRVVNALLIFNLALSMLLVVSIFSPYIAEASELEETKLNRYMRCVEPIDNVAPEINQKDIELLACVIYQEAGGDACCDDCRRRVADVVLNRVNDSRFPNDIHSVLTQPNQYGRYFQTGVVWPKRASNQGEKKAVERAYRIAEEVLSGHHSDLYGQGYIWQALFKQGKDQVYCCGTYFGR